jgi:zinc-ribbon domain/Putative adhesin
MAYCTNCGATIPDSARFCSSCGAPVYLAARKNESSHQTFHVSGKAKLVVNIRTPGSIDVRNGQTGLVEIDSDIGEPQNIDYNCKQEGDMITISSRTKSWNPLIWGSYAFSVGPRTNVRVAVPPESDLDLETQTDSITANGIKGKISAQSKTGPIHFKDSAGTFTAKTHTGNVDMDGVDGLVDVRNTIGHVSYAGSLQNGENTIRTTTGDIEVALRGTPDLKIDASTTVGRIICRLELSDSHFDRGDFVGQRLTGKLGSGSGRLFLEATTGSISIYK